jgi:hypothetical protein
MLAAAVEVSVAITASSLFRQETSLFPLTNTIKRESGRH